MRKRTRTGIELTMDGLSNCIRRAKEQDALYVAIQYRVEGLNGYETVITKRPNYDVVLSKIKREYSHYLMAKDGTSIVNFTFGNTYRELGVELY